MGSQLMPQDLGTILGVWAHPDDEIFSSAGVMAAAAVNGQSVACVTATKGEQGVQDPDRWPPDRLGEIRVAELRDAYAALGISHHHWLGYPDGGCDTLPDETGEARVLEFIDRYSPDTILTFGPEGMTGHPDHQAVSRWATAAGQRRGVRVLHAALTPDMYEAQKEADQQFNMFFNIDQPPITPESQCALLLHLEGSLLQKKCNAFAAMPSQTAALLDFLGFDRVCAMNSTEAFTLA